MLTGILAGARLVRRVCGGQEKVTLGVGGTLAEALDHAGTAALVGLLRPEEERLDLEDDGLVVSVQRRADHQIEVTTRWDDTVATTVVAARPTPVTDIAAALQDIHRPLWVRDGQLWDHPEAAQAAIPAMDPARLGSASFRQAHGVKYAYIAGAMAGGIGSPELVTAMGRAGYIGFFGAGGLPIVEVNTAVEQIRAALGDQPAGFNLLHNPAEPAVEEQTVDLYLRHGCRRISASAYLGLTPAVVRFRLHGIHVRDGRIVTPNKVLAKVSRPEVAEHFLRPAPEELLLDLVSRGVLTPEQLALARQVPVAEDITAEADSGGHTDRRPLSVLVPLFRRLADRIAAEHRYAERPRIGAAGGIGDPWSLHAALALGADYVLTGSINQATNEAATSPVVKELLAQAAYSDVAMGPAPDMFEQGAQVQVLARGSLYAQRASKLRELYLSYPSIDALPEPEREKVEKQIFRRSFAEVWDDTRRYWAERDPREIARAEADPRHQMALCFRWYLGMTSRWARAGDTSRKLDFQVWCGPALGLFNDWVRGTALAPLPARGVVAVADALLHGACVVARIHAARMAGLELPPVAVSPRYSAVSS